MACKGSKGILSIPIHSYIDNTHAIIIEKTNIDKYNNIEVLFSFKPRETKSINNLADAGPESGYRENYNERYD